jgi:hypothetical protein
MNTTQFSVSDSGRQVCPYEYNTVLCVWLWQTSMPIWIQHSSLCLTLADKYAHMNSTQFSVSDAGRQVCPYEYNTVLTWTRSGRICVLYRHGLICVLYRHGLICVLYRHGLICVLYRHGHQIYISVRLRTNLILSSSWVHVYSFKTSPVVYSLN